jgi:hypothetical protein
MSGSATKSFKAFCASITSSSGSVVSSPAHVVIAANASEKIPSWTLKLIYLIKLDS